MSRWQGSLYVNIYDQTAKEIDAGRLPIWTFHIPAHTEPGLQKAPAVFPRGKISKGGHKYKDTAPHRPSRMKTSEQFLIGTFNPSDRFEVIGALSTTKLEDHDPEAQVIEDPYEREEAYPQIFVNKGLRVLDGLSNVMKWDDKEVRRLQEQPYKGIEWKLNFRDRSLTVFADPNDGGEKHFYRYGKKGECIEEEKGLCAGCVRRAKERSARRNFERPATVPRPRFAGQGRPRRFDDSETEVELDADDQMYPEAIDDVEAAIREVRAKSLAKKTTRTTRRKTAASSSATGSSSPDSGSRKREREWERTRERENNMSEQQPPRAPKLNQYATPTPTQQQKLRQAKKASARQQREQWHHQMPSAEIGGMRDDLVYEMRGEREALREQQQQQQLQQRESMLLVQPKPQRPATILLQQDEQESHPDFMGLEGREEESFDDEATEEGCFVYGGRHGDGEGFGRDVGAGVGGGRGRQPVRRARFLEGG